MWAFLFLAVLIDSVISRALAKFEEVTLILHLFGFFAVLIPLVYLAPYGDASIFSTLINEGAWPTKALSLFVGLSVCEIVTLQSFPKAANSKLGADCAVQVHITY